MKKLSLSLLILSLFFSISALTEAKTGRHLQDSIVMVIAPYENSEMIQYGTGFFISPYGHILTNEHVIHGGKLFKLCVNSQDKSGIICHSSDKLKLLAKDINLDLALLQLPQTSKDAFSNDFLTFGNSDLAKVGDALKILGYPANNLITLNRSQGRITEFAEGYILTDTPIAHGNSGSPAINGKNQVIGIAVGVDQDNTSILISSNTVQNWLASVGFNPKNESRYVTKIVQSSDFVSRDGNFSINFPGKPEITTAEEDGKTFHYFTYLREDQIWMVAYADMSMREFEEEAGSGEAIESSGALDSIEESKMSTYMGGPAIFFKAKAEEGFYMTAQIYFIKNRFYIIAVVNQIDYPDEQKAKSFIKSFKLISQ